MKNIKITLVLLLMVSSLAFSQIPAGYYDSANGLEGYSLKTALHNIINNHNSHSYDNLYSGYETTDVDNYYENDGTVLDMYSENPTGPDPYNWTHQANHCGNYSNEGDCFNREHLFPQGFFGSSSPMVSDIHFIVPTDGKVNGMRSNYPLADVSSANWTSLNGSMLGSCADAGYSGTVFEPIDEFKGDIARMLLYFVTRYEGQLSGFSPSNSNNPLDGSENRGYEQWYVDVLLSWHNQDPVSQREIDRNNAAYAYQNNRNPFIDHPEYVECIWLGSCNSLSFTSTPETSAMVTQNYTYNITYNVGDDPETISCTSTLPTWLTFSKDEANNTALLTGTPQSGDVGNVSVTLELTDGTITRTQNFTIVVSEYSVTQNVIDEDFSNCPVSGWVNYSVASDKNWDCSANTISINGYGGNTASDDWYISPALDLDNYNNEILTFKTWLQYSDDGITDPEVKLEYSTNYSGSGDPSSATWNTLSYTFPTSSQQQTWTNSGNVDMSGITGNSVYLAFHYTSSGTGSRTSAYWQVDDVLLVGDVIANVNSIDNNVKIFPNPAKNILNIKSVANISEITISNIIGQEVIKLNNTNKKTYQINIENLHKGVYIINCKNSQSNIFVYKFIKE